MTQYEKIEKYISNEMDAAEKALFEQELSNDAALKEDYLLYTTIEQTMKQDVVSDKSKFNELIQKNQNKFFVPEKKVTQQAPIRKLILIGLSAAAILVLIFTLLPKGPVTQKTNEELYAYYAKIDPIEETIRGNNDSLFLQAAQLYNQKKYEASSFLFEKISAGNVQAQFYLGIAYTEMKAYEKAILIFDEIAKGKSVFNEKANWQKVLVYLKKNDLENCKKQIRLINVNSEFYSQAQQLLKELK